MKKIFKITYWTNQYFEEKIWNTYFCKSPTSTAKKIRNLLKGEKNVKQKDIKHIWSLVLFNLKYYPIHPINIYCGNETDWRLSDVYILITQEELF